MTTTRRSFLGLSALTLTTAGLGLAGCSDNTASASTEIGTTLEEIIELAQKEGKVQLIAYPETWANYKGHFEKFKAKYGVDTPVASPEASSAEELQSVKQLKGQKTQPDVLDIGYTFTETAISEDLISPYKPSNFDAIPEDLKDPEGRWVGAYYGVLSLGVNTKLADKPEKLSDLLDPAYKGKVALPGDPREGASSIATVFTAALANGGSLDDVGPGIEFFAELAASGNLVNISSVPNALSTGQAAVVFDWNYNFLGIEEEMKTSGVDLEHFVPEEAVFGNFYAQPCTIDSPQPNAARLWVDWLTSDEGSEQYALGGAIPARFTELSEAGKLSEEALAKLPEPKILEAVNFPTVAQGERGAELITREWAGKVRP
ncbi:ABC transporter substrate-binding protein [Brevibacterium luteolum]|uniref:Extracellular solute-binding protein n=1 Tax=Brevibacterium luteolum TaxID=199591 RepID=A0A849ARM5_9MICO|nr:extracellular solute-binding protein [Brevibacterium luteolum]MBM7528472.1 putative spermidine/putrescine transport system substrate-binding protein [Brevibacterium luteolum]NNG79323.1 extracellular solute-binding protein [Brevibacterium luteolum]